MPLLFATGGVVFFVLLAFWIWALFDCISTDASRCRNLPKVMWLIIVLILPDVGSLAWLLLGRPARAARRPGSADYAAPRRPVGFEDRPGYGAVAEVTASRSAELDKRIEQWENEQRATELNEREAELRRRELELHEREQRARGHETDGD